MELISGASRARTGDIVPARDALSQLSYGPRCSKCSGEFVVLRPVDAKSLVVPRRAETQLDVALIRERVHRQQIAPVEIAAVRGKSVDVFARVVLAKKAIAITPIAIAPHDNHIAAARSPFALDSQQAGP